MKFEKLSENKIRITLSIQDLAEKDIDFHVFMSNSIESQSILLDMLREAKKETGFDPEDYNLRIEALAMADTNFIFTITKIMPDIEKPKVIPKKKFSVKRKNLNPSSTQAIYAFSSFEDFCAFLQFLKDSNLFPCVDMIADTILLYSYKNDFYLLMSGIHPEIVNKIRFYTSITEFARYITNSKVFASKLKECGCLLMGHNALAIGFEHFIDRKISN